MTLELSIAELFSLCGAIQFCINYLTRKIMQATVNTSVEWPRLSFGPINLWSFPAAWKRDELPSAQSFMPKVSGSHQVNPLIARILSHR